MNWLRRGTAAIGVVILVLAAVAALVLSAPKRPSVAGSSPSPASLPTEPSLVAQASASPEPTQSVEPTPTTPLTATDACCTSAPGVVSIADHDRLWDPFMHFGPPIGMGHHVESLRDAADLADVIVLGTITELYIGEMWQGAPDEPASPTPYLKVQITEVLKGDPLSRTEGFVEVMFGLAPENFDDIQARPLPEGEYLWFLIHNATEREELGAPPRDSEIAPYAYYPPAGRGAFLNDDGQVGIVLAERLTGTYGDGFFPLPMRGADFANIIGQVRQLVVSP